MVTPQTGAPFAILISIHTKNYIVYFCLVRNYAEFSYIKLTRNLKNKIRVYYINRFKWFNVRIPSVPCAISIHIQIQIVGVAAPFIVCAISCTNDPFSGIQISVKGQWMLAGGKGKCEREKRKTLRRPYLNKSWDADSPTQTWPCKSLRRQTHRHCQYA